MAAERDVRKKESEQEFYSKIRNQVNKQQLLQRNLKKQKDLIHGE
jgi:hypothetical protein